MSDTERDQPTDVGYLVAGAAWLAACFAADINAGRSPAMFILGGIARAMVTFVAAGFVRWLYVRRHGGDAYTPETLWIAAGFAAILALFRLT